MEKEKLNLTLLKEKLNKYNQMHLLDFLEANNYDENLYSEILNIDFDLLGKIYDNNVIAKKENKLINYKDVTTLDTMAEINSFSDYEIKEFKRKGYEAVYQGKVALYILAGGQGSRLGSDDPKGMFNIKMPSNKSLFEYLFNRILSCQNLSKKIVESDNNNIIKFNPSKILIQTSEENHNQTVDFLKNNNYFGLDKENVIIFPQDMIYAVDINKKIIIKNEKELFKNPNGNGGCFSTIKNKNILDKCMGNLKIEALHVTSIDNPLIRVFDPFFLGWYFKNNILFAAKYIEKVDPNESVGLFLKYKNLPIMLDYGDTPKEIKIEKDNSDKLKYRAGNSLNYLISVEHLNNILNNKEQYEILQKEYHSALKNIQSFDILTKQNIKVEGYKFELFFNSIFQFCPPNNSLSVFESFRDEEFSPVKNKDGDLTCTPSHVRRDMSSLFFKWIEEFVKQNEKYLELKFFIKDENETIILKDLLNLKYNYLVEIDFTYSYNGENLFTEEDLLGDKTIKDSKILIKKIN